MLHFKANRHLVWVALLTSVWSVFVTPAPGWGGELEEYLYGEPASSVRLSETVLSPSDSAAASAEVVVVPDGASDLSLLDYDPTAPLQTDDGFGGSYFHDGVWPARALPAQWGGVEVLAWWRKGRRLPPLVTDGVLAPGVNVLFGNGYFNSDVEVGGRATLGYWLDNYQRIGVGGRIWGLDNSEITYNQSSTGATVLARPFTNTSTNPVTADAFVVATAGQAGQINIVSDSVVYGGDIFLRKLITSCNGSRLDVLYGYQYSRINEGLNISTQNAIGGGGNFTAFDNFDTENEFHGGLIGLWAQHERGSFTVDVMGKVALGNMRQIAKITGGSNGASPNAGLLAQATNIGVFTQNEFIAVPEVNLTVACHLSQHLDVSLGYSMLYWSRVLQPGDIVDLNVDPTAAAGATTPGFAFNNTDYWVQGLSLGVNWVF